MQSSFTLGCHSATLNASVDSGMPHIEGMESLADHLRCDGMLKVIKEDMKLLGESEFSKNKNDRRWPALDFHKVSLRNKTVYVYHHKQHVAFSSTHFSQLRRCGIVGDVSQPHPLPTCAEHNQHNHLQPFFLNNQHLMSHYKQRGHETMEKHKLLEEILDERTSGKGTIF